MLDLNPEFNTILDFDTPIYTLLDLRKTTYTDLDFAGGSYTLIFEDLNLPQFATEDQAIEVLAGRQAYQLITSRVVKVTPPKFVTNFVLDLSKAFSWLRRFF